MTTKTFLVEIGTEELPPKSLKTLAKSFSSNISNALQQLNLSYKDIQWFATPRRLAVKIHELQTHQPDSYITKRGPALSQAYNADGQPTPAALGWAKGCGISIDAAEKLITDKGEWLTYTVHQSGQAVESLLVNLVTQALHKLPINKPMRWGNQSFSFIRPLHSATLLYGDAVVPGEIFGITIDRRVQGHRFMGESWVSLPDADSYPNLLETQGKVMADYQKRQAKIVAESQSIAQQLGAVVELDPALLDEVTALVEWPVALTAEFEERFLQVPAEALVYTMKGDQKYFPVYTTDGKLTSHFIFISNIESLDPSKIIAGNQKVIRPRLSDAEFFFKTDRKQRLEENLPKLESVLFQKQLGTLRNKTERLQVLSTWIAQQIGANTHQANRAGLLSKCDLMTNMVFEFPETQGIMGMHYAQHDGEDEVVALALNEQYLPRFATDKLPTHLVSCALSLADKIDTLVGIFGINQHPKGDKDPFALRRAALGVIKICIEKGITLNLDETITQAIELYGEKLSNNTVANEVFEFILGRLPSWYQEQGYQLDTIQSVMASRPADLLNFDARVKAVTQFRQLAAAENLSAANKRVANILNKNPLKNTVLIDVSLLKLKEEITLAANIAVIKTTLAPLFAAKNYEQALNELANLQEPVDAFFEHVMVMDEDLSIRNNRLALLTELHNLFLHIADIALLQPSH